VGQLPTWGEDASPEDPSHEDIRSKELDDENRKKDIGSQRGGAPVHKT